MSTDSPQPVVAAMESAGEASALQFAAYLSEPFARFDARLRVTFANAAFAAVTGYSPRDCQGKACAELGMSVDSVDRLEHAMRWVLRSADATDVGLHIDGAAGDRHFVFSLVPHTDATGCVVAVFAWGRDTTELETVRAQLMEQNRYRGDLDRMYSAEFKRIFFLSASAGSGGGAPSLDGKVPQRAKSGLEALGDEILESHFRAIVESSDDAIVSKTLDGKVTSWNRGAEKVFGYTEEEMLGKSMLILFPKDKQDEELFILERLLEGERVDHFETVRVHKDGHTVDVSVSISPLRNRAGKIVGASKIARDISQVKRQQQRLQMTLEATSEGLWDWDMRTGKVQGTAQYFDVLGGSDDTGDFEFFKRKIFPDDLARALQTIQAHLNGDVAKIDLECRLRVPQGAAPRWVQVRGRAVERDAYGNPVRVLGTVSDITVRKLMEEALRRATP